MSAAIEVKDLHIIYRTIKAISVKKGLRFIRDKRQETFEAVRGITFSVEKGEIVGLVGENGSGKSTTLLALAGIFAPDMGTVNLFGNTVSLLAIGVGFQTELTGRVNIMLTGLLLGFTEKQIRQRMSEIIRFSELGEFIDKPVATYSSGMYSKLAFSITAVLETDIILIDEVLSVGDSQFRKKSFKKMQELISAESRTVIIVSHNSETLRKLCNKIIWMHKGKIKRIGETESVLDEYDAFMEAKAEHTKSKKSVMREEA